MSKKDWKTKTFIPKAPRPPEGPTPNAVAYALQNTSRLSPDEKEYVINALNLHAQLVGKQDDLCIQCNRDMARYCQSCTAEMFTLTRKLVERLESIEWCFDNGELVSRMKNQDLLRRAQAAMKGSTSEPKETK